MQLAFSVFNCGRGLRWLAAAALLPAAGAQALSLTQAYEAALKNDAAYIGAVYANEAGQESRIQGRAALLPNVTLNYARSKNDADLSQPSALTGLPETSHLSYHSGNTSVVLRQPLFDLAALARYRQGEAQASYSAAVFDARTQDLALRTTGAYFDALYAREQVALATVQRAAMQEQLQVNQLSLEKGAGTRTDVLETQARLDLADADLAEARDNETTALAALAAIVGQEVQSLTKLRPGFRTDAAALGSLEQWQREALARNPEIAARARSVDVAREEISKNQAAHAPRIELVAAYAKSDADTLTTYQQESTARSVGVQLSMPLFAGGATSSHVRQAAAEHARAKAELQAQTDQTMVEVRRQYSALAASAARVRALDKAVESGRQLMAATELSIRGGARINLDLLNARQQLFTAQRDLAQARLNYLRALLRLRAAAGSLGYADVREVAAYFE